MNEISQTGQKKFIQYWIDLYNYTYETGDPHLMQLVSDPQCKFCNDVYAQADELFNQKKAWRVGTGTTLNFDKIKVHPEQDGFVPVDVEVHDHEVSYYDDNGPSTEIPPEKQATTTLRFWIYHRDAYWYMGEVGTVG